MSKLYDIIDWQTNEIYEEKITLEEAKDTMLRFMCRSIDEEGEEYREENEAILAKAEQATDPQEIGKYLAIFDYDLVEHE